MTVWPRFPINNVTLLHCLICHLSRMVLCPVTFVEEKYLTNQSTCTYCKVMVNGYIPNSILQHNGEWRLLIWSHLVEEKSIKPYLWHWHEKKLQWSWCNFWIQFPTSHATSSFWFVQFRCVCGCFLYYVHQFKVINGNAKESKSF